MKYQLFKVFIYYIHMLYLYFVSSLVTEIFSIFLTSSKTKDILTVYLRWKEIICTLSISNQGLRNLIASTIVVIDTFSYSFWSIFDSLLWYIEDWTMSIFLSIFPITGCPARSCFFLTGHFRHQKPWRWTIFSFFIDRTNGIFIRNCSFKLNFNHLLVNWKIVQNSTYFRESSFY